LIHLWGCEQATWQGPLAPLHSATKASTGQSLPAPHHTSEIDNVVNLGGVTVRSHCKNTQDAATNITRRGVWNS
jgi:hypothetical protein